MRHTARPFRTPCRAAVPMAGRVATVAGPVLLFDQEPANKMPLILFSFELPSRQRRHGNRHCHTVLRYASNKLLNYLLPANDPEPLRSRMATLAELAVGEVLTLELAVPHHNGSRRWLRSNYTPSTRDTASRIERVTCVAENITQHWLAAGFAGYLAKPYREEQPPYHYSDGTGQPRGYRRRTIFQLSQYAFYVHHNPSLRFEQRAPAGAPG